MKRLIEVIQAILLYLIIKETDSTARRELEELMGILNDLKGEE